METEGLKYGDRRGGSKPLAPVMPSSAAQGHASYEPLFPVKKQCSNY